MKPAVTSRRHFEKTKMMVVRDQIEHRLVADLPDYLRAGDLLLVNAASTLPASFTGTIARSQESIEIRLSAFRGKSANDLRYWSAVSFGQGDWRNPTEERGLPPELVIGDTIQISPTLAAFIVSQDASSPRLVKIKFMSEQLVRDLYLKGNPIQYSYHQSDLQIWDQQTLFNGPPISVEPPSAAFPLTWHLLLKLKNHGVKIATVVHSAGISSTGQAALDALLPLEEYFEVPANTLNLIHETQARGGRIAALGTSVTRAVESAFASGERTGLTSLKLGPTSDVRVVDILITGMHEEGTSHAELMKAFCGCEILSQAENEATALDYRSHEYGDWTVLDCR